MFFSFLKHSTIIDPGFVISGQKVNEKYILNRFIEILIYPKIPRFVQRNSRVE